MRRTSRLLTADGHTLPAARIPCTRNPRMWDAEAILEDRRTARRLCVTECPALEQCGHARGTYGTQAGRTAGMR